MLRGYDLNSQERILKDEEATFPMNHLNPRVQHLDTVAAATCPSYLHHQSTASSRHESLSSPAFRHVLLPRPSVMAHAGAGSPASTASRRRLASQSLYPYNLALLSPSERSRLFYQKRIPGGANILVNDAWMVLPMDTVPSRRPSAHRESPSSCGAGCRRHSCPIVDPRLSPSAHVDRASSSSSRDSCSNNNSRNESDHNHRNQHSTSPPAIIVSNSSSSKSNKQLNRELAAGDKSVLLTDVTDTKL